MRLLLIVLACILVLLAATPVSPQGLGQPTQPRIVPANLILVVIQMKYADPADMAFLFGGSVIQGGGMFGGGGQGGSSGYGGGSGNSGYGGSSRGGSSRGSSGNSGYGQR